MRVRRYTLQCRSRNHAPTVLVAANEANDCLYLTVAQVRQIRTAHPLPRGDYYTHAVTTDGRVLALSVMADQQ
jgi:hypothetical protein